MNRRDYIIIFCLLLPFFITLPWLIVSRQALGQQKELVELTKDTLHINNLRCARFQLSNEQYIERNEALEKNNETLIQKLTERGVKVVTQELPPNPKFFTENAITQQIKIEELISVNEQLRAEFEALQQGESATATAKSVSAPQLPPVSDLTTTASQKQIPPPNRNKEPSTPLVEAKSAPQELVTSPYQPKEKNKPTVKSVAATAPISTPYESTEISEPVVKNTASTEPMPTTYERMEMSESKVKNAASTERVSTSNQNKETSASIVADQAISAPVVSSAFPSQPTEKKIPLYNLVPKGIRIIAIGERMQEQITRAGIEGLAGENFRVDLFIQDGAETSSSVQQRIVVEFDLKNVPEIYYGARELFLVLTNRGGEVVVTPQSTTANVPFNGSTISLKTTARSRAKFGNSQHLRIQQNLSGKLAKGIYRAQVYSDLAVLGMIDFEVL